MLVQSQERVPFVVISPEYTHTVLAKGVVLAPAPSTSFFVSSHLPGGWQQGSGCYLLAMVDLINDALPVIDSVACVRFDGTILNVGDTVGTLFSHSYIFDPELLLGRSNVCLQVGPLDLSGHTILSRLDLEIYRDESVDDWLGTIDIKSLILAVPQNSTGSVTPTTKEAT